MNIYDIQHKSYADELVDELAGPGIQHDKHESYSGKIIATSWSLSSARLPHSAGPGSYIYKPIEWHCAKCSTMYAAILLGKHVTVTDS